MNKWIKFLICVITIEFIAIGCVLAGQEKFGTGQNSSAQSQSTTPAIEQVETSGTFGGQTETPAKQPEQKPVEPAKPVSQDIDTALNIKLTGSYLDTYNKAVAGLTNSTADRNKKLIAKIGLQILQSKVIKYENALHFYSLSYTASGGSSKAKCYDLKDCINRINNGQRIYTDCFGFVRLTHSIACYTLSKTNPGSVAGLSGLYGYKGSYTGSNITSLNKLSCGTVIYDRLTGTGSTTNRHVAIYLYTENGKVVYMDQSRIFTGEHKSGSYIYSAPGSRPYKFNTYKSYCV